MLVSIIISSSSSIITTNLINVMQDRKEGVIPAGGSDAGEAGVVARGAGFETSTQFKSCERLVV